MKVDGRKHASPGNILLRHVLFTKLIVSIQKKNCISNLNVKNIELFCLSQHIITHALHINVGLFIQTTLEFILINFQFKIDSGVGTNFEKKKMNDKNRHSSTERHCALIGESIKTDCSIRQNTCILNENRILYTRK